MTLDITAFNFGKQVQFFVNSFRIQSSDIYVA